MHSPKFQQKSAEFRRIVAASILTKLWSKKRGVRDHMRQQIIPDAVEFLDFHMQHRQRCAALSHAKILMLATALWNPNVSKLERTKLLGKHSLAMTDTYYRQTLSWIITSAR